MLLVKVVSLLFLTLYLQCNMKNPTSPGSFTFILLEHQLKAPLNKPKIVSVWHQLPFQRVLCYQSLCTATTSVLLDPR